MQVVLQRQRVQTQPRQVEQQREQLGHDGRHAAGQARQVGPVHLEHVGVDTGPTHRADRHRRGAGRRSRLTLAHAVGLGQQVVGEAHANVGLRFRSGGRTGRRWRTGAVAVLRTARGRTQRGVQKVTAPGLAQRLPDALHPRRGRPTAKRQCRVQGRHAQQQLVRLHLPLAGSRQLRSHGLPGFARALVCNAMHRHHRHTGHHGV